MGTRNGRHTRSHMAEVNAGVSEPLTRAAAHMSMSFASLALATRSQWSGVRAKGMGWMATPAGRVIVQALAALAAYRYRGDAAARRATEKMALRFTAEGMGAREAVELASVLVFRLYGQEPRRG